MKLSKTSTLLAASAMLLAASASAEYVEKKAVRSTNGEVVRAIIGGCVITQWDSVGGECGAPDIELRTVYFNFNGAGLTPAAKNKLNNLAIALKSKSVRAVSIVGYADQIGAPSYNLRLSQKRANAVAAYLSGKGIKVIDKAEVRGLGETASRGECQDMKGKALQACLWRDRRVEVEIVQ